MWHTKGTSCKKCVLCLLCAHHNVPDVRTYRYLGMRAILKFGIRAFQRRVPIQIPTKTRWCSSLQVLLANCGVLMWHAVENKSDFEKKPFYQNFEYCHSDKFCRTKLLCFIFFSEIVHTLYVKYKKVVRVEISKYIKNTNVIIVLLIVECTFFIKIFSFLNFKLRIWRS